jgi:hypothetical protein
MFKYSHYNFKLNFWNIFDVYIISNKLIEWEFELIKVLKNKTKN